MCGHCRRCTTVLQQLVPCMMKGGMQHMPFRRAQTHQATPPGTIHYTTSLRKAACYHAQMQQQQLQLPQCWHGVLEGGTCRPQLGMLQIYVGGTVVPCQDDPQGRQAPCLSETTHLPQLDIVQLRIGVDVGVGHANELPAPTGACVGMAWVQCLQHSNERNIVLQAEQGPFQRLGLHVQAFAATTGAGATPLGLHTAWAWHCAACWHGDRAAFQHNLAWPQAGGWPWLQRRDYVQSRPEQPGQP